jgi:hypothetical protein
MFVLRRHDSPDDHLYYVKKAKYEKCYSDLKVILTSVLTIIRMRVIQWVYESLSDVGEFGPGGLIGLVTSGKVTQSLISFDVQASDIENSVSC